MKYRISHSGLYVKLFIAVTIEHKTKHCGNPKGGVETAPRGKGGSCRDLA
jgi:hypothetical protein